MSNLETVNGALFSKDVRLEELTLTTTFGEVTLLHVLESVQIYESIFSHTLSGNINITDANNIPELFELSGGEKLTIKFKSAMYSDWTILEFYIYKISERMVSNDRIYSYSILFTSKEQIRNELCKFSRFFGSTDDFSDIIKSEHIVTDLLRNNEYGLNSTKNLEIDESVSPINFISPFWTPLKCIDWISKRTVSALYSGSPYVFFENKIGFTYASLAYLGAKRDIKTYTYSPKAVDTDPIGNMFKIESFHVKSSMNILERINNGGISSSLNLINLYYKDVLTYNYSYDDTQSNLSSMKLNSNSLPKFVFDGIDTSKNFTQHQIRQFTSDFQYETLKNSDQIGANYGAEQWALQRESSLTEMEQIVLQCSASGDSKLNAGDIITFNVPSFKSIQDGLRELDKYLSGRYLVTSICHNITRTNYDMSMEIAKDSVYRPLYSV
jgi:hypothetical protein